VHTTLETPGGLPIEVQIRTEEMHAAAEFGISLSCLLLSLMHLSLA
jgi:(p)ppGpp synthase/HD superfamily hydrolase